MDKIDWSNAPYWADRVVRSPRKHQLFWANDTVRLSFESNLQGVNDLHVLNNWKVVERRAATAPVQYCESVMRQMPGVTIEQRIASLRALEKRVEETRAELTRDLESLGLTWMVQGEPTITDRRDLRVGDVIWIGPSECSASTPTGVYEIKNTDHRDADQPVRVEWDGHVGWPDLTNREWRFIRRP